MSKRKISVRNIAIDSFLKGGVGAEIGVFQGDFSQWILQIVRPKTLLLIDTWVNRQEPEYAASW